MAMRPTKCRCKTYKYSVVIPILSAPGDATAQFAGPQAYVTGA